MITRRLFLRNSAAAGAVGTAIAAPSVAAEQPELALHELASYHANQLAEAMGRLDLTMTYRVTIDFEHSFALVAGHKRKGANV